MQIWPCVDYVDIVAGGDGIEPLTIAGGEYPDRDFLLPNLASEHRTLCSSRRSCDLRGGETA